MLYRELIIRISSIKTNIVSQISNNNAKQKLNEILLLFLKRNEN